VPGAENFSVAALIAHMGHDKKVADGRLTFVLPAAIGRAFVTQEVPLAQLESLLESALRA
jgi:3-dehydroquinate synthase